MDLLYLFLGLGGLLVGAEMAVGGSLGLAKRFGWPSWVAGVVLLALGTSLPEFFVALASAPQHPGLALGTVFGSNAINVGGVLGLMLVLQRKGGIPLADARPEILFALLAGSGLAFIAFGQAEINVVASGLLLGLFGLVLGSSLCVGTASAPEENPDDKLDLASKGEEEPIPLLRSSLLALAGFAMLALASNWFLRGALNLADLLGWDTGFAGFMIAAAGTSAPEFFTSIQAMRKGHVGAVFGNVLGSNAFNLLLVGGTAGVLAEVTIDAIEIYPQLWVNLAASAVLALPLFIRREGGRRTKIGVAAGFLLIGGWMVAAYWIAVGSGSI
ncbi:MAG: hypothetical protein MK209_01775 [Planctomycetes bacterium]|nr:hypothetical protein [Planctomycetota bacterium]